MADWKFTKEEYQMVGEALGYIESHQARKGRRFMAYLQKKIKNWEYDETVRWGDMYKLFPVFKMLAGKGYLEKPKETPHPGDSIGQQQ